MNTRDVRSALVERLAVGVDGVAVHRRAPGSIPHTPAVVVVRQGYPAHDVFGDATPTFAFNLVALVSSASESNGDVLDDLVDDIVAVFDDAPTLDGGAGQAVVTRIGDEDRVDIGGQNFYATTIEVEVLT